MSKLPKKFRAVLRWSNYPPYKGTFFSQSKPFAGTKHNTYPHYVLPATPEAYDAQVEAVAKACYESAFGPDSFDRIYDASVADHKKHARAALASLGIRRPAKQAKGGRKT